MKNLKLSLLLSFTLLLLLSANVSAAELDTSLIGVKARDKFAFTVERNNMTHPVKHTDQPFWVEKGSSSAPMFDEGETFEMEILSIGEPYISTWDLPNRDYNASYTINETTVTELSDFSVVRRGLVIATDWEFWLDNPPSGFNGEVLIGGVHNLVTTDNGDTFSFNLTISTFSSWDSIIDTQVEVVTYDKTTGVATEIHIIKTFYEDGRAIEELLFVQAELSGSGFLPGFTAPIVGISLLAIVIYRRRKI